MSPTRLSAVDMINLAVETPSTPMAIGAVLLLDGDALPDAGGPRTLSAIRRAVESRLVAAPPLRQVIRPAGPLAGRPVWVDDPAFDLDRHVLRALAPPPGDEAALLRLAARLMRGVLDRRYPLWRIWVVTGLAGGQVAVVVKLHHVLADGLAAIQLVLSTVGAVPADGPGADRQWLPAPAPTWGELVADRARGCLAALRRRPRRPSPARRDGLRTFAALRHAARLSLNAPVGPRRRLAVLRIDLAEAKRVAHRHGGKVNDVVLSLATGGVRSLLHARGEPVKGLSLHTTVAMSLRTPGQEAEGGNRAGGVVVRLPAGEADPRVRLTLVAAESARAKRGQPPTAGNALLVWLARLGLAGYLSRHQHMVHFVESNIAGPPAPVQALGAPVLDVVPIGNLAGNLGVSFLALSYAGRLVITVQADADRFPDLPVLVAGIRREWAVLNAGSPGSAAAA
ncbi:wax ester/triacylglycerol synthase family O-acyltransferase [Phytohabitans sp. ZYX-F-186]|uniref:diacylglycerol O-acyltransferase n=1 Tax=Phytohabitans maris TaxID=3071409 RepID=A0ABU0ZVQ3_9ACTN|nr:wax ester/triacylglycerol synthase domain-containing protein [Phytohabitans sp. ZYX-F-186]MDQ7910404.1 wax ester/triacylglycerol synthase family O-acyltransferase [Phytohabitans sp. ZYX-F-186]